MTVYVVEQYHWDRDFWSPVGKFSNKDVANSVKEILDRADSKTSCSVSEMHIIDSVDEFLAQKSKAQDSEEG